MVIFDGRKKANEILFELKKEIKKLKVKPGLAVISVSFDPASQLFIKNKKKMAQEVGIKIFHYQYGAQVKEKVLLEKIKKLNNNKEVNGIIVQLPLAKRFNTDKIINQIDFKKDVDGFRQQSQFSSPLILAIFIALKSIKGGLKNKKILALTNSDIFAKTLKDFLKEKKIKISCSQDRKTPKTKSADILITVLGEPGLIQEKMVKNRIALIDAGITVEGKNKIKGDVNQESVSQKASFLTPVPGGIGPLNVALLLNNVYLSCR